MDERELGLVAGVYRPRSVRGAVGFRGKLHHGLGGGVNHHLLGRLTAQIALGHIVVGSRAVLERHHDVPTAVLVLHRIGEALHHVRRNLVAAHAIGLGLKASARDVVAQHLARYLGKVECGRLRDLLGKDERGGGAGGARPCTVLIHERRYELGRCGVECIIAREERRYVDAVVSRRAELPQRHVDRPCGKPLVPIHTRDIRHAAVRADRHGPIIGAVLGVLERVVDRCRGLDDIRGSRLSRLGGLRLLGGEHEHGAG